MPRSTNTRVAAAASAADERRPAFGYVADELLLVADPRRGCRPACGDRAALAGGLVGLHPLPLRNVDLAARAVLHDTQPSSARPRGLRRRDPRARRRAARRACLDARGIHGDARARLPPQGGGGTEAAD